MRWSSKAQKGNRLLYLVFLEKYYLRITHLLRETVGTNCHGDGQDGRHGNRNASNKENQQIINTCSVLPVLYWEHDQDLHQHSECNWADAEVPNRLQNLQLQCHAWFCKVGVPSSNITTIWTPVFEWYVVRCGSKNGHQRLVFKRDWATCSKYLNYSRLSSQHVWGNQYGHLMSMRIFTLIMNKIFIWAPKILRQLAKGTIWIC